MHILLNTLYLIYFIVGKKSLITLVSLPQFPWASEVFDCLPHDLILAKPEACGLSKNSLKIFLNYLEERKQRVKIGSSCSFWCNIKRGAPQGPILGKWFRIN